MKYVFICRHGEYRSLRAARITQRIAKEKSLDLETDYFGVSDSLPNSEKRKILEDADKVFIMEEYMRSEIRDVLSYTDEILCLNITDDQLKESEIEEILRARISSLL